MLRKNNRLNRQNVSKHQFLNDFRGTRKSFFSQSKAPSARWWSAALIEVQPFRGYESCQGRLCRCWTWLTWLFFQHIWTLSDREFVAVLGRWSRRSFLLHEVDDLLMYQRRELANLPVMGNAGASIHQGAGSRLHLGWQTGVLYVERAWLLHFNFTSDTATTISWFVNIAESRLQTSNH